MAVRRVRVGDALELQRRKVALCAAEEYVEVGLRSFGKGVFHKPAATGAQLGNKKVYRIEPDDLVISNVFAWEGALAVASESERGLIGSHRFMAWIPRNADQVNVRYLWHYFLSEPGLLHLRRASPGSAGRNRTLGIAAFEDTNIPLPDLSEQQRIAARLDRLASLTGGLDRTRLPLARVKERILATTEVSTSTARPLRDLLRTARIPLPIEADQSYRPLGVRSFGNGLIRYPATRGEDLSKLRYFSVRLQRLVISNIKAWEGAIAVTRDGDETLVASSRFLQWEVADPAAVDLQYLRLFFATPLGLALLGKASPGSADRNRTLSSQRFLDIAIPLPSPGRQRRLVDLASQIETIQTRLAQRDAISSALLPAARNEAFAKLT